MYEKMSNSTKLYFILSLFVYLRLKFPSQLSALIYFNACFILTMFYFILFLSFYLNSQRKTLNPCFDEVFKFPITYEELQEKTLCMKVYDFDKFSRHDAIGDVKIRLCDINVSRQLDVWSDLVKPERVKILNEALQYVNYDDYNYK